MTISAIDPTAHQWRQVVGDPAGSYFVNHEYTILGFDRDARTLDMLVRWAGDGGHCPMHRHVASTSVLVLEGEQHLWDILPDGSRGEHRMRRAGDYALSVGDAHPHLECGGPDGALVFFGCHADDGVLYEIVNDALDVVALVTIDSLIADWEANT